MSQWRPERKQRLRGKSVFLSASVPGSTRDVKFRQIPDAQVQIEEAVVSLARAVLSEEGRLVFGGHPSISLLVGLVAGEYASPRAAEGGESHGGRNEIGERREPLIQIYQSEAYREHLPDETMQLFRQGFASIHWVRAVDGERFNPEVRNEPQCTRSLEAMRRAMLEQTAPIAMICIGGMEGVFDEARMYREIYPRAPIFTFETTGGAASRLAEKSPGGIQVIDRLILEELQQSPPEWTGSGKGEERFSREGEDAERRIRVIPYPVICQLLVRRIAELENYGSMR